MLNVIALRDFAHRVWNDCKIALGRAGYGEIILLIGILYNINFGPWDGSKWWPEVQIAEAEYVQRVGSPSFPLFVLLLPLIARDQGETDLLQDEGYAQTIWDELATLAVLTWKGPKMALCRWFSLHSCYYFWQKHWNMRLVLMLYWSGFEIGNLSVGI